MTSTLRMFGMVALVAAVGLPSCSPKAAPPPYRTFETAEEAVKALGEAVARGDVAEFRRIFGPDADDLINSADPVTARRNREVFGAAYRERWTLQQDGPDSRTLVVGNEEWPFPIPLVRDTNGWHFDTAAGKEEVLARRIGRNELAAIRACRRYVAAQRTRAQKVDSTLAYHGYYFRVLSGEDALLAWPVEYDNSGVMTFVVDRAGVVHQKDFGPDTAAAVRTVVAYNPDSSWTVVQ